jgi:hypothetical protein
MFLPIAKCACDDLCAKAIAPHARFRLGQRFGLMSDAGEELERTAVFLAVVKEMKVPRMCARNPAPAAARAPLANAFVPAPCHLPSSLDPEECRYLIARSTGVVLVSSQASTQLARKRRHRRPPTRAARIRPRRTSRLSVPSDTAARAAACRNVSHA